MYWNDGWGDWVFMIVTMLVFWGVLVWAVVVGVRAFTRSRDERPTGGVSPRSILEERFARGEIDRQEFEERRGVLTRTGS